MARRLALLLPVKIIASNTMCNTLIPKTKLFLQQILDDIYTLVNVREPNQDQKDKKSMLKRSKLNKL